MQFYEMEQLDTFQADITVVSLLEHQDNVTLHLVVPWPPVTNRSNWMEMTPGYRKVMVVTSAFEDDLADATWEDAEWQ